MNILNRSREVIAIVIGCLFVLASCKGDQTQRSTTPEQGKSVPTFVANSLDCKFQKNITASQRAKLLIFDPTGIFPEELYATSPSNKIKNDIISQKDFREWATRKCDIFFVTQDCPDSAVLTKEHRVTNFPTFMLIGREGRVLYKKEKLMSLEDLYQDLEMIL